MKYERLNKSYLNNLTNRSIEKKDYYMSTCAINAYRNPMQCSHNSSKPFSRPLYLNNGPMATLQGVSLRINCVYNIPPFQPICFIASFRSHRDGPEAAEGKEGFPTGERRRKKAKLRSPS